MLLKIYNHKTYTTTFLKQLSLYICFYVVAVMMIIILFLYFLILLSLCLSFLLHVFKNHIHLFLLDFVTAFNSSNTRIHNYKLHPKSSTTTTVHMHVLEDSPPLLKQIGFIDNVVEGVEGGLMTSTETLGFNIQSIDIKEEIDDDDDNNDDDLSREKFPPPLPSLNENGQPNFILVPVRKNGRLQLSKVRMKRPKILYSMRQDGRLRLFLAPDQCVDEDSVKEEEVAVEDIEEKMEEEEEEEEEVMVVKSMEEEEDGEEVVEDIRNYEEKDVKVGEWKFPNERFRKCHQVMNRIHAHRSHNHHLHMYGFGIA